MVKEKACAEQKFSVPKGQKRSPKGTNLSTWVNGAHPVEMQVKVVDWDTFWVHHIDSLLMVVEKALNKP